MDFTQPWDFGDGIFVLEDKKIYVNNATLAMSSEVFRAMFTADFAEKEMTEIPLPQKKFDDFLVLMQAVHPPHTALRDNEMENNVECILPLSHEYQMHHVVENCEKYLLTQPPSIHNLILADKFSLLELRKVCIENIKDIPLQKLDEEPDFKKVESESRAEIYRRKLELGGELSKQVICNLMSQPPSIESLLLAEKYDLPQVYKKCLQYLKDTPLSKLKAEPEFRNLKPDTLNEVLNCKVDKLETLQTEVSNLLTCWGKLDETVCSDCRYLKGTSRSCLICKGYRFDKTREAMKKYS